MTTSYRFAKRARKASVFSKIAPILATGFGFVAFALVIPSNTSSKPEARIFTQGLSIQIDHSSPAFAALEDTLSADTQADPAAMAQVAEVRMIQAAPTTVLFSGVAVAEPIALKILRDTRREDSLLIQEHAQRLQNSHVLVAALSQAFPTVVSAPRRTVADSGGSVLDISEAQASGATVISNGQIVASVSERFSAPTNAPVTKSISRKDLERFFLPLMASAVPPPGHTSSSIPQVVASSSSNLPARMASITSAARLTQQDTATLPENPNANVHQVVISGPLEFTGGVAITSSNDRIVVYRENDEEKLEPAQVWLREAKYEVFVDQPVGRLVGELRSISGEILGRGYFELARLPKLAANSYRIEKISMMIGPIPQGIAGRVMTAAIASEANPKAKTVPVKNAHVQLGQLPFDALSTKDGTFKEESLVEGSTVIAHADRPGHWGALAYASAGSSVELPMFSDATMRSIMQAATGSDHEDERTTSFVWGKITRGGQPVQGAHVDLMTSEVKPVYFNAMMLPDSTLKETSANGLYAFFPVEPGSHAVQAADSHGVTEPSLFPTDQQTATQVNLELNVTRSAKIRVYDAFKTDWPLAAEVVTAGRKRGAMVPKSGEMTATFTGGNGLLMLDTDAGPSYANIRVAALKSQHKIDIPMVQTVWIERLKGEMRVNADARSGTIIGFIRGTPAYQVSLEKQSLGTNTKVVYFDARGELTQKNYGEVGGGFMMMNVPEGFRTVLVQPSGTTKALASVVLVESRVTNLISKTF